MSGAKMKTIEDTNSRAKFAIIMIWVIFVLEVLTLTSSIMQYKILMGVEAGQSFSDEELDANDMREGIVAILYLVAYLISAVAFISWFRTAYGNLHKKAVGLAYTPGWAAGAWFVPFLNLVRPYQIMKELYARTQALFDQYGIEIQNRLSDSKVGLWWLLWIAGNLLGQLEFRMGGKTFSEIKNATTVSMISAVFGIALCLVTVRVIGEYAVAEPALAQVPDKDSEQLEDKLMVEE